MSHESSDGVGAQGAAKGTDSKEELRRVVSRPMLTFFIIGDILGTGIYALVGEVGANVGGAIWVSFLVTILVAFVTAFAYAELVTKYPYAAGAALYVNKAFGIPFLTFMVAFAVVMSGITSASAAGVTFGGDYLTEFVTLPTVAVALAFLAILSLVNFWGISESVKLNLVFTTIELSGLLIIIVIGLITVFTGQGDPGRAFEFKEGVAPPLAVLSGATLAFFAMVGFEDSVNIAEETRDPSRVFPRALFIGLAVTGTVYLLVAFTASMVVPTGTLAASSNFVAPTVMPVLGAVFCFGLLTRQEGSVLVKAALLLLIGLGLWLVNRVITGRVETLKAEELA